ncbi:hypothetical protein ACFQO7_31915 [Catellatospora aurea]|uniref:Uncharacterized protein n=1 Tax=Catellatospora aurea TaxID=1337874 RepID=A0ABW2H5Q7_9ACTN
MYIIPCALLLADTTLLAILTDNSPDTAILLADHDDAVLADHHRPRRPADRNRPRRPPRPHPRARNSGKESARTRNEMKIKCRDKDMADKFAHRDSALQDPADAADETYPRLWNVSAAAMHPGRAARHRAPTRRVRGHTPARRWPP